MKAQTKGLICSVSIWAFVIDIIVCMRYVVTDFDDGSSTKTVRMGSTTDTASETE